MRCGSHASVCVFCRSDRCVLQLLLAEMSALGYNRAPLQNIAVLQANNNDVAAACASIQVSCC